jgi:hypothetical protein
MGVRILSSCPYLGVKTLNFIFTPLQDILEQHSSKGVHALHEVLPRDSAVQLKSEVSGLSSYWHFERPNHYLLEPTLKCSFLYVGR